jgi:hypothetical protein
VTRYGLDARAFVELARIGVQPPAHQLVGPASLRSEAMALVYRDDRAGVLAPADRQALLDNITTLKARLLGDRVSRATAWKLAQRLGLDDTRPAEYLAVVALQADALIALDPELTRLAEGVVPLAAFDALGVG